MTASFCRLRLDISHEQTRYLYITVARAHAEAMELTLAANKRFLISAASFNNRLIVDLPLASAGGGDLSSWRRNPRPPHLYNRAFPAHVQTVPSSTSTQYAHNNGFGTMTT